MNRTDVDAELDGIVNQYLSHLDHALAKMEASRRAQLVEEIDQHIADLRSTNPVHNRAELENLLDRVGRPGDIAAAALEDEEGNPTSGSRRPTPKLVVIAVVALIAAILAALGIADLLTTHTKSPGPGRTITTTTGAPATATMPNVIGTTLPQAEIELQALGLNVSTTRQVVAQAPPGVVVSQAPAAASRVVRGSDTTLVVSLGPRTTTTSSPVVSELPSGVYLDGAAGTPHYYVSLTSEADGTISGSLSFPYQDGQTSAVFSFSGHANSGTATVTPSTGNGPISVTYSAKAMQFGECTQYLKFAQSLAQCTFTYSAGGALS